MTTLRDVEAVLDEASTQLDLVRARYQGALRAKAVDAGLQVAVKNVVENQRSALEYLASAVVGTFGAGSGHVYYPMAPEASAFIKSMDSRMKGVRAARPDIAAVIEQHQPFQPDHVWMQRVRDLTNENKHQRLTPQTRDETRWIEVTTPGLGSVGFTLAGPGKAGVSFGGQVSMNGVEVDPQTMQPVHGGRKPYTETIYVDWLFEDRGDPVLSTLEAIQVGVSAVVRDVRAACGW